MVAVGAALRSASTAPTCPRKQLSTIVTEYPDSARHSAIWEPMYPAPPVTKMRFGLSNGIFRGYPKVYPCITSIAMGQCPNAPSEGFFLDGSGPSGRHFHTFQPDEFQR